jgi:hypothetical protein
MSGSKLLRRRLPIDDNIYRRAVTVFRGSLDQMNAALEALTRDEEFEPLDRSMRAHWRVIEDADGYEADYICILAGLSRRETTCVVVHECLHHTANTLRRAGLKLTPASEEAYAYYLEWIVERVLNVVQSPRAR